MIQSFRCKHTAALFEGRGCRKKWLAVRDVAERKLQMVQRAVLLGDLKIPPQNHLKVLKGDRVGQHAIRINDQYRICFVWTKNGPTEVEIVDYH